MSILNSTSSRSVCRGYDYKKEGNVISHTQLSDFEYEGEVQGTNKTPYNVIINTKHPKSSSCDCPFANANTICKHMVALFFAISPEDLKDYEDWSENDYEDEYEEYDEDYYDEYYEYERYGNCNKYKSDFIRTIFFDELLSNAVLDKINKSFYKLAHDYDYNNKDYTVNLLSKSEKEKISSAYDANKEMKANIDKIILNPEILTYNNYKWIATLYKNKNKKRTSQL